MATPNIGFTTLVQRNPGLATSHGPASATPLEIARRGLRLPDTATDDEIRAAVASRTRPPPRDVRTLAKHTPDPAFAARVAAHAARVASMTDDQAKAWIASVPITMRSELSELLSDYPVAIQKMKKAIADEAAAKKDAPPPPAQLSAPERAYCKEYGTDPAHALAVKVRASEHLAKVTAAKAKDSALVALGRRHPDPENPPTDAQFIAALSAADRAMCAETGCTDLAWYARNKLARLGRDAKNEADKLAAREAASAKIRAQVAAMRGRQ